MKTALITGISGQDGAYLSKLLLEKEAKIIIISHIGRPKGKIKIRTR